MICNGCKSEFTNIDGLKFCPYCGAKIEEVTEIKNENTLPMPAITDKDIKKFNKDKFFVSLKGTFKKMKVIIPIILLLAVVSGGVFAYTTLSVKAVDEVRIKEDLIGKVVTLPKGTSIKITKDYIKAFSISSRIKDKNSGNDMVKVSLDLNNGAIEVKTLLSLVYIYEGKKQWKMQEAISLEAVTELKPVVGMDEKKFLEGLKKLSIDIYGTPKVLGAEDVKSLGITTRTPDLDNNKEEILLNMGIDSGLLAASGNIKCKLVFKDEAWSIEALERNSDDDFKLVISPNFSDEKVIEAIRKQGLEETVTYENFFSSKGFKVKDSFTKSINISSKNFDAENGTLNVTAKRENVAGQIKSTLSTKYTFKISYDEVSLLDKSKTTVDSGKINDLSTELIISTIVNAEIEGSNLLFWFSDNHKITSKEASSFKLKDIVSKNGIENIKYVYGSINYSENKKSKEAGFVGLYFLVYDEAKGYNWKLNKLVGEDSPNYNEYKKTAQSQ
ncbi:hypothetical protein LGK97_06310 [Clostridium sp. CS001]|uniref:hypothetical protein n=1 Tax=Clostridium sp. CS001 TaxID=2880648 RepID=UPI001CF0FA4C|nr:hypothetical protein [Clostridium sp. CS001]MCB2289378.1 hypothetical protein [Clostridium sp. CS001]